MWLGLLPMRQADTTLGSLTVYSRQPGFFANRDLLLMEGVVAQAAVALSAARRFQDERRQARLALTLLGMGQLLTVERSDAGLATIFDEQCRALFEAERGLLFLGGTDADPAWVAPTEHAGAQRLAPALLRHAKDVAHVAASSGQIVTARGGADGPGLIYLAMRRWFTRASQWVLQRGGCLLARALVAADAFPQCTCWYPQRDSNPRSSP